MSRGTSLAIATVISVNMLVAIALAPLAFGNVLDRDSVDIGSMNSGTNSGISGNDNNNNSPSPPILQYKIIEITSPKNGTWFRDAATINGDQTYINMKGYAAYLSSPVEARNPEPVTDSNLSWYLDNQFIGTG